MLKWSQAVLLAFHAMALLAARKDEVIPLDEIAQSLNVSADHLSKVMQRLVKCNMIKSVRGPQGGYSLDVAPESTTMLAIYECVEGELVSRTCMLHETGCESDRCIFGNMIGTINATASGYLSAPTLSDVAAGCVGRVQLAAS